MCKCKVLDVTIQSRLSLFQKIINLQGFQNLKGFVTKNAFGDLFVQSAFEALMTSIEFGPSQNSKSTKLRLLTKALPKTC